MASRAFRFLLLAALGVSSISCSNEDAAGRRTGTEPQTESTTSVPAPATTPCATNDLPVHGESVQDYGDVDGDGEPDEVFMDSASPGGVHVGVRTAAGRTSETEVSANISTGVAGQADVNGDGVGELWVVASGNTTFGRELQLVTWSDCDLVAVRNPEGERYTFKIHSLSDGDDHETGSGVGCVDVDGDGRIELVGLNYERSGDRVTWHRTRVDVKGAEARNGAEDSGEYLLPGDAHAVELLREITCGERTMSDGRGPAVS